MSCTQKANWCMVASSPFHYHRFMEKQEDHSLECCFYQRYIYEATSSPLCEQDCAICSRSGLGQSTLVLVLKDT